jgi:hypothetical protein
VKNKKRNAITKIYSISRMQTSEWSEPAARSPLPAAVVGQETGSQAIDGKNYWNVTRREELP